MEQGKYERNERSEEIANRRGGRNRNWNEEIKASE